jgi:hypothetical protein
MAYAGFKKSVPVCDREHHGRKHVGAGAILLENINRDQDSQHTSVPIINTQESLEPLHYIGDIDSTAATAPLGSLECRSKGKEVTKEAEERQVKVVCFMYKKKDTSGGAGSGQESENGHN